MAEALEQNFGQMGLGEFVEEKWAYHVTSCLKNGDDQPTWSELRWSLADDPYFDGPLFGFPCVFFATTVLKGRLPEESMYPRNGAPGQEYWRVAVPLQHFNDYEILFCYISKNERQVRLVLARPDLAGKLREQLSWTKNPDEYLSKEELPEGTRWRVNDYNSGPTAAGIFVNFVILGDFVIPPEKKWDGVKHGETKSGYPKREKLAKEFISAMVGHANRVTLANLLISAMAVFADKVQLADVFISAMTTYPNKAQLGHVFTLAKEGSPDRAQLPDVVIRAMEGSPDGAQFADVVIRAMDEGYPDRAQLADVVIRALEGYPDRAKLADVVISAMEEYPDKIQLGKVSMSVMGGSPDRAQLAEVLISAMIDYRRRHVQ